MLLDVLFRSPPWLRKALPAVLTFTGGGLILAGFLGINLSSEEEQEQVGGMILTSGAYWEAYLQP